jgi:hypothetical protein
VLKDKWRYNLSMRLAADKYGKVRQTAEKWRIDVHTATAIAEYRFDEVDWFGLIYEVRGIQGDTDFVLAPAEIHFSEIDHFASLDMVVKRIENALSLDSAATNSLSSAVDKAHEYFKDNCNSELTREDDIDTIQTFFKEMWSSVREEWYPVVSGRAPLQTFPDVVVPRSSSCWGTLDVADEDSKLTKALVRSKALSKVLGIATTRVSYPAGMARPGAAGSSRSGRSRSPSPSAGRAGASRDDTGGGSRSPRASASPRPGDGPNEFFRPGDGPNLEVFWKNATDFSYSSSGPTVIPASAALALGVAKGKFCWPVVASLKRSAQERRKYCQTRANARCISGEAHVQSDEMRAHFDQIFRGKRKKDFDRGRDLDGPDRDHTSKAKAAKLASDLEAEMAVVPAGWPPSTLPGMGGLGARMAFGHPTIIPGYASAPEDDAANAAAALLGMGAAEGGGASHGGGKGGGGRGTKGGKARGSGAKGGTGKEKQEGTADGEKGGKSAARGGGAKRRGSGGGGKGGGKGGGRGRGALVTFASGAAGGARSGADASVPGGGSTSHSGGRETQFQLSVGTARCHTSSSHAAVTPVNSADITGSTSAWGSYGAPLDAGSRLNASSSRELSFSDNQHQQGADDFCAYYGLGWTPSTPSTNESDPSTDGCVRPRLRFAASALGNVAAPRSAARAAVPILLAPLASSYSKIILYVLAISATSAPSLLLPAGGGVWGRAAPRTFAGAMAMKGASAAATRWAPALFVCEPVGLTAHYVAAQRLSDDSPAADAAACTNWLAVCLVSPGLEGAPGTVWRGLGELGGTPEHTMASVAAYRGHSLLYSLPSLASLDPIFDGAERDEIDEALGVGGCFEVGKRPAMPPLPGPSQGFEREPRSFEEMWAVHRSEVAKLKEVFSTPGPTLTATEADRLAGPLATGFGDAAEVTGLPDSPRVLATAFDAIWAADCPAWHARVAEADPDQIPLALREAGALASFTDSALAMAPFASRCRPPVTASRPPPANQRSGPPGPRNYEGFYPTGHFRAKADPWLLAQHTYLLDALEHGEACTVKPPKALLFSDHERLPEFRGRLYEYSAARDEVNAERFGLAWSAS